MNVRILEEGDLRAAEEIFELYFKDEFGQKLSKKLNDYINKSPELVEQDFKFYVAEDGDEIVGACGMRSLPSHMSEYAKTLNPAELYVLAVKYKNRGVGKLLRDFRIKEARRNNYTELLFFSAGSHKDAWPFHDRSDFKRVGTATAPDGESGVIWGLVL